MVKNYNRFGIYLVALDPTIGSEIKKTRPCIIISPDEMNKYLKTVIIAPMTTKGINIPSRIYVSLFEKKGQIALDQIRTVDKERLIKFIGYLDNETQYKVTDLLQQMFAY